MGLQNMEWIENQVVWSSSSFWRTGGATITHALAFLTVLLALWKFPRGTSAFDPNPRKQPLSSTPGGIVTPGSNNNTGNTSREKRSVNSNPLFPQERQPHTHVKAKVIVSGDATGCHRPVIECVMTGSETDTFSSGSSPEQQQRRSLDSIVTAEPSVFMKEQAPESTMAERYRFLVARDGNEQKALVNLLKYLEWKRIHLTTLREQEIKYQHLRDLEHPNSEKNDIYDWTVASQTALKIKLQKHANEEISLPRIAVMMTLPNGSHACDMDGRRIIHLAPAQMDSKLCSLSTYALAIALYLDRKADRNSIEKVTISLDLRPGKGWANIPGVKLIPFIKDIVTLLLTIFPERLHKNITYPLPYALSWVFAVIKKVIDPGTAKKLCVITGSAGVDSPLPFDELVALVDKDVLMMFEKGRLDAFIH